MRFIFSALLVLGVIFGCRAPVHATQFTNYTTRNAAYQYLVGQQIERCFPNLIRSLVAPFGQNIQRPKYLHSHASASSNLESMAAILSFHSSGSRNTDMSGQFLIMGYDPRLHTVGFHVTANEYDAFGIMAVSRPPSGIGSYDFEGARTSFDTGVGSIFHGEGGGTLPLVARACGMSVYFYTVTGEHNHAMADLTFVVQGGKVIAIFMDSGT